MHTLDAQHRSRSRTLLIWILSIVATGSFVVLVAPYIPKLWFMLTKPSIDPTNYRQAADQTKNNKPNSITDSKPGNRLVLPDIGVNTQIIDGSNIYVIGKNQGVWRESANTDPTKDGNIVIAGHRFLYTATNGGWFYNLPQLKIGQKLYIRWQNKTYEYEVYNSRTVSPTQVDIRNADPKVPKKLTLYTCYPLGSTAERFVIEAKQL